MSNDFIEVRVKGLREIQAALEALGNKEAKAIVKKSLRVMAKDVIKEFASAAPRYAGSNPAIPVGFLAKHFNAKFSKVKSDFISASILVGPDGKVDFPDANGEWRRKMNKTKSGKWKMRNVGRIGVVAVARWLEFGTRHQPAHPFMRPAFAANASKRYDTIRKIIAEQLAKYGVKV